MSKLGATVYYRPADQDGFTGHQGGFCAGMVAADLGPDPEGHDRVNLAVFSGDANFYSRRNVRIFAEGPIHPGQCVLRSAADVPLAVIMEKINEHGEIHERLITNQDMAADLLTGLTNRLTDVESQIEAAKPAVAPPMDDPAATVDSTPAEDESQDSNEAIHERSPASVGAKGDDQESDIHP